jgi:UDP-hydrolysing UDP-N-acetyl-D-glucosamine 2-epimerase
MTTLLPPPRTIAVLTSGRQDWGILRSTALALRANPATRLVLLVGGTHLVARHGRTLDDIVEDGFEIDRTLAWLGDDADDPPAAVQAARALELTGAALAEMRPEALLLVGDRFETMAAAVGATIATVPLVHLHGGEQTGGAFDDAFRHAITKLAHLHLVSHEEHAARVRALGEDPSAIQVVGAPGLDNAVRPDLPDRARLEARLGIALRPPVIAVTVHPVTLDPDPAAVVAPVLAAMDAVPATYVVTLPNVDPGSEPIRRVLLRAVAGRTDRVAVPALGERDYWGLLRMADAVLGNSSSALIEAPAVDLPAVDVGDRQLGRRREANVIHAGDVTGEVVAGLHQALDPAFRRSVAAAHPPLADGHVGERIARIIAAWQPLDLPRKPPIPI